MWKQRAGIKSKKESRSSENCTWSLAWCLPLFLSILQKLNRVWKAKREKSWAEEAVSYLEQVSTRGPKFEIAEFLPRSELVGECLPQTVSKHQSVDFPKPKFSAFCRKTDIKSSAGFAFMPGSPLQGILLPVFEWLFLCCMPKMQAKAHLLLLESLATEDMKYQDSVLRIQIHVQWCIYAAKLYSDQQAHDVSSKASANRHIPDWIPTALWTVMLHSISHLYSGLGSSCTLYNFCI